MPPVLFRAVVDTASSINAKLEEGLHVVLAAGIFNLDAPLQVKNPNTVILGLGMATLVSSNGNAVISVADVPGVRVAGLLLNAGPLPTKALLEWGTSSYAGNAQNPGMLHDVFAIPLMTTCVAMCKNAPISWVSAFNCATEVDQSLWLSGEVDVVSFKQQFKFMIYGPKESDVARGEHTEEDVGHFIELFRGVRQIEHCHSFQFRFRATQPHDLYLPEYLVNIWPGITRLGFFWVEGPCKPVPLLDIYRLKLELFASLGWVLFYIGVCVFITHMYLNWVKDDNAVVATIKRKLLWSFVTKEATMMNGTMIFASLLVTGKTLMCTRSADSLASVACYYSGSDSGETVEVKLESFAREAGTIDVTGSGLEIIPCLGEVLDQEWTGSCSGPAIALTTFRSFPSKCSSFRLHRFEVWRDCGFEGEHTRQ